MKMDFFFENIDEIEAYLEQKVNDGLSDDNYGDDSHWQMIKDKGGMLAFMQFEETAEVSEIEDLFHQYGLSFTELADPTASNLRTTGNPSQRFDWTAQL